ncbi:MAG: IS4-like element ISCku4 family transposase, partial [Steroidobacteraceae bacterium]
MRRNAVAYEPIPPPTGPRKRGRPRRYGEKIKLRELFESASEPWQEAPSPVYGERDVTIRFLSRDLRWRPLRRLMRFVLVIHPTRGRCIFICTDLTLAALEIICGYGSYRAKVRRKIAAYHLHIQVGLIAQGLLQYVAFQHPREV